MLPSKNRLKKKKDFERVFKEGKGVKEEFLYIKVVANNLTVSRVGFIVSQKVSKKAVLRNKIKRRLREITKEKLPKIKQGLDIVLTATPEAAAKDFSEMEKEVDRIFTKAKIYNV